MNWDTIEGKWAQMKGTLRAKWGKLTDDDVEVVAGKRERLIGKLQERYGYAKDRAESAIDEWMKTLDRGGGKEPTPGQ